MRVEFKHELQIWAIFFATIFFSAYIHEFGHCIPAWIHGYWAVPTPVKEYESHTIPLDLKQYVSLGGIIGSVVVLLVISILYLNINHRFSSVLLAGALAMPGMYTLRFILIGRGHDATEFQEAQSALGLSYSGHSLDWFFLTFFLLGAVMWITKSKPSHKILGRLLIGFVLTFVFVAALQKINNAIFDPILGQVY